MFRLHMIAALHVVWQATLGRRRVVCSESVRAIAGRLMPVQKDLPSHDENQRPECLRQFT